MSFFDSFSHQKWRGNSLRYLIKDCWHEEMENVAEKLSARHDSNPQLLDHELYVLPLRYHQGTAPLVDNWINEPSQRNEHNMILPSSHNEGPRASKNTSLNKSSVLLLERFKQETSVTHPTFLLFMRDSYDCNHCWSWLSSCVIAGHLSDNLALQFFTKGRWYN